MDSAYKGTLVAYLSPQGVLEGTVRVIDDFMMGKEVADDSDIDAIFDKFIGGNEV